MSTMIVISVLVLLIALTIVMMMSDECERSVGVDEDIMAAWGERELEDRSVLGGEREASGMYDWVEGEGEDDWNDSVVNKHLHCHGASAKDDKKATNKWLRQQCVNTHMRSREVPRR